MKFINKYLVAFLLISLFSTKVLYPIFSSYFGEQKIDLVQQDEKSSEEKSAEKTFQYKVDPAELRSFQQIIDLQAINTYTTSKAQSLFLPVQYFAIPTPPPWCNS